MFKYYKHSYTAIPVTMVIQVQDNEPTNAAEMSVKIKDNSPKGARMTCEQALQTALSAMKRGEWEPEINGGEWDEFEFDWTARLLIERHRTRS